MKLRPPLPTTERSKRILVVLVLAVAFEKADPLPWLKSPWAWFFYGYAVFEIIKQFVRFKMENSLEAVARAEAYKKQLETKRDRVDPTTRYRVRRGIILFLGFMVYGQIISLFTDRCEDRKS